MNTWVIFWNGIILIVIAYLSFLQLIVALRKREDDLFKLRYDLYAEAKLVFCCDIYDAPIRYFKDQEHRYLEMDYFRAKFQMLYGDIFAETLYKNLPKLPPMNCDSFIQSIFDNSMKKMYPRLDYESHFTDYLILSKPWWKLFSSYKEPKPFKKGKK